MADALFVKLDGAEETERLMKDLAADMRRRVVIGALRDAAKPVIRATRAEAPVLQKATNRRVPGTVRKNISSFRSKRYKASQGALGIYITVRATRARLRKAPISGDPFYFRPLITGHKIVRRVGKGLTVRQLRRMGQSITERRKNPLGFVKADDFIARGWKQTSDQALQIFNRRIIERINKANAVK